MSGEPSSKRRKMNHKKQIYSQKQKFFLEPGIKGFLATCNFREKDCVRECYNLLNEYADQNENEIEKSATIADKSTNDDSNKVARGNDDVDDEKKKEEEEEEEEEDVTAKLEKELQALRDPKAKGKRFQQVETKVPNCIFIKTTVNDPHELGVRIVRDIAEKKKRKTRMLLRFLPIDAVCRANVESIKNAAGQLFDKVFLNVEPTTFSIVVNKRFNNDIDRMGVIRELADMVTFKNSLHKVDLKNAKLCVVIEVIKGLCCISVLPDYNLLKKYNVSELTAVKEDKDIKSDAKEKEAEPTVEAAAAAAVVDDVQPAAEIAE